MWGSWSEPLSPSKVQEVLGSLPTPTSRYGRCDLSEDPAVHKIPVSSERPRWRESGICHLSLRPRLLTLSHHVSAVSPPLSLKGALTLQGSPRHTRRPPAGQDWGPAIPRWEWITLSRAARHWTSLKLSEPPRPLSERRQAPLQPPRGPSNTTTPRPSDRMGKLPERRLPRRSRGFRPRPGR